MITGTQKEIDRILPFMTGRLQKALAAVRDLDLETLPLGKTIIDGEEIFVSTNEYETEPFESGKARMLYRHPAHGRRYGNTGLYGCRTCFRYDRRSA